MPVTSSQPTAGVGCECERKLIVGDGRQGLYLTEELGQFGTIGESLFGVIKTEYLIRIVVGRNGRFLGEVIDLVMYPKGSGSPRRLGPIWLDSSGIEVPPLLHVALSKFCREDVFRRSTKATAVEVGAGSFWLRSLSSGCRDLLPSSFRLAQCRKFHRSLLQSDSRGANK